MSASTPRIAKKYLLVINIPHYETAEGRVVDDLWCKDLQLHRVYLEDLRLASPVSRNTPPENAKAMVDVAGLGTLHHVPLPDQGSTLRALRSAPRTLARLWKAVGEADVVHAGVAGWPYPLGWPAVLFAKLRRKSLVVNIESAPWRLDWAAKAGVKARLRAALYERLARICVNSADLPMFTQEAYRDGLLKPGRPAYVDNASWIDPETVLSEAQARSTWEAKPASPLRLLFAARVTEAKGILVLLEAVRILAAPRSPVAVDVMGEGDALEACRSLAGSLDGPTTLGLVPPRPYGPSFFEAIRLYHAVVVPNLSDEQPRIIYDAYSQALPVLASDTPGDRSCTFEGRTGLLVPPGDPGALADGALRLLETPALAREMGMNALRLAQSSTHREKHIRRARILAGLLQDGRSLDEVLADDVDPTREFRQ